VNVYARDQTNGVAFGDTFFSEGSGRLTGAKNPLYSDRWNWGAFFFGWLWLLNHGNAPFAIGSLALDLLHPPLGLAAHIYWGLRGNDLAYDGRKFRNAAQFVAVQNAWRDTGIAVLLGVLAMIAVSLAYFGFSPIENAYADLQSALSPDQIVATGSSNVAGMKNLPGGSTAGRGPAPLATPTQDDIPPDAGQSTDDSAEVDAATMPKSCASMLSSVHDANAAPTAQEKYDASVGALRFGRACKNKSIQAMAFEDKAFAEKELGTTGWDADLRTSIGLYLQCANAGGDARDRDDCRTMATEESRLKAVWQLETH
jgi:hypothetical protein